MKYHVAIPMAGHSRRFKSAGYNLPKALLRAGDKMMIEHVFEMFDERNCAFHVIINTEQLKENPEIIKDLSSLAYDVSIEVIVPHEIGPVHSVLMLENIPNDEPLIISYCDFYVEWDFKRFLYETQTCDGAVPAFKGFHPASFGDTYYAYMRCDNDNNLIELREKNSFTDERHNEPASAGIYYFRSMGIFRSYAKALLNEPNKQLPEAYVSLLFNNMVNDGLKINVPNVSKFICLGTPEDYEQYLFWYNYFHYKQDAYPQHDKDANQVTLIPMAGRGSRFLEYGYRVPKPLIHVDQRPMIMHSIDSHPPQDKWIFVVRKEDVERHNVRRIFETARLEHETIAVSTTTSGQAATCLLAEDLLNDDDELFISSCDYRTIFNPDKWEEIRQDESVDGAIWITVLNGLPIKNPHSFAYCVTDENNVVTSIVEKNTISDTPQLDPLVIGTFWFRKVKDFKIAAHHAIDNDIVVNGEHYVGTSINHLIELGRKIVIFKVDQWISFGDPFELNVLEYWREHFVR